MDQDERGFRIDTGQNLSQVGEGVSGNSKNLVNGVVSEAVIVKNSEGNVDWRLQNDVSGSCKDQEMDYGKGIYQSSSQNDTGNSGNSSSLVYGKVLEDEERGLREKSNGMASREECVNQETPEIGGISKTVGPVDQGSSGSSNMSVSGFVVDTIIVINTQEAACGNGSDGVLEVKDNGLGLSKVLAERPKTKVAEAETKAAEAEEACVIDIKGSDGGRRKHRESWDGDKVCRICHLNSEQSLESADSTSTTAAAMDLIQLGCGCKDELGIAHSHCAEAWFKLKGNRMCEICGQTAKNITGVRDNRFIEDWHDQGSITGGVTSSDRAVGCWRGQPFCNFLMACLVIAFVLPWFFRVNMF